MSLRYLLSSGYEVGPNKFQREGEKISNMEENNLGIFLNTPILYGSSLPVRPKLAKIM